MANKKITELTELTTPAGADLFAIVDDTDTTTKKVTVSNLMTQAPVQTADISGFATTVSLGNHELLTSSVHGISAFGSTLVDDADAATARTTLGLGALATESGVEGTAVISTGETGGTKFLREDGDGTCSWQVPEADVEGPLTTALRGTTNPHIGAYPNQSFKVIDNPYQSVMVVADEVGNLKLLNSLGINNIAVGFSVVEDSTEPDIEAVGTLSGATENYSVISGDSDSKGVNGLPLRQGFNNPDIGANPAPILISGGSIA
jgi:hypothetical protein